MIQLQLNIRGLIATTAFTFLSLFVYSQCDTEVSGIYTYCNAIGTPGTTGYFVAFRVIDPTGDTLNVVDLNGNNVTNRGKRIDDINTQNEPATVTVTPLMISGVGTDTLEFWYFGPYANGTSFDIALVDPNNDCDTIFIASGTYNCADNSGISDPAACDNDVPLFFLDFSQTEFMYGGGGGGNENFDEIFLIMQRTRESLCCDLQPSNQNCFEFIVRMDEQDVGLAIDDIGSGSTAGEFYADTLNMFSCTGVSSTTWPFTQGGGQSSDLPLCLEGGGGQEFVVLSCKSGGNVTGVSIDAISSIFSPPDATIEPCNVSLEVFNVDTAFWSSPDDPNLDNFLSCNPDSLFCSFLYDTLTFGLVTACEGDTFTYIVSGISGGNDCIANDTILSDTTFVIVYPTFSVEIDTTCHPSGDSLILTAIVSSAAMGCDYAFNWSNGDTTPIITVAISSTEYFVEVTRSDLDPSTEVCVSAIDSVIANSIVIIDCQNITDTLYACIEQLPEPDTSLVLFGGCGDAPFIYSHDISNGGEGCIGDTLIITRLYIADFDSDTIGTTTDRDTCVQQLLFVDDIPPVINCPANTTITVSGNTCVAVFTYSVTSSDNCSGVIQSQTMGLPSGSSFPVGTTTNIYSASDGCTVSTCSFTVTIVDNVPPMITCPSNITIQCTASTLPPATGTATATDNCSTPTLTFTDVTAAGGCPSEYTITRTWRATDGASNTSTCVQTLFVDDSTPPEITCPSNVTIECTENTLPMIPGIAPGQARATATDNCSAIVVSFNDVTAAGGCPSEYTITRTWKATDVCSNSSTCVQTLFVDDSTPPEITCPSNVTIECTENTLPMIPGVAPGQARATATDNCSAIVVSFSDVTAAGGCPQEYTITRTWRATDVCNNSSTCVQTIFVDDSTPPVITCPANVTLQCTASTTPSTAGPPGQATATDNCSTPTVTFTDVTVAGGCPQERIITRTWRATDACSNSSTCVQTIFVDDSTPPVITCPSNVTIQCTVSTAPSAGGPPGQATATDNCSTPTVTFTDITVAGGCPQERIITRTWRATDGCNNSSTCIQTIFVDDSTPPVITCPSNVTVECTASTLPPLTGTATATDNCSTPGVTFSDVTVGGLCPQERIITRTWRATDACNNTSTCIQTITVDDSTPPVITCPPADLTLSCAAGTNFPAIILAWIATATATDACDQVITITTNYDGVSTPPYSCEGGTTITFTATDDCGNSATCTRTILKPCFNLNTWVYLEGAAINPNGAMSYSVPMRTTLNDLMLLPGQSVFDPFFGILYTQPGQPYDIAPWNYFGTEGDGFDSDSIPGDAGYPSTVVDWVLVNLRDDTLGLGGPICQAAALLHNDGRVEFVEDLQCCAVNGSEAYHIVIEHRNHLIVMSDTMVSFINGDLTYDFRITESFIDDMGFPGLTSGQKMILMGVYAMYGGNGHQTDMNSDTDITFNDRDFWEGENGEFGAYNIGDYNLNGDVNFNDRLLYEQNNSKFTSVPRN